MATPSTPAQSSAALELRTLLSDLHLVHKHLSNTLNRSRGTVQDLSLKRTDATTPRVPSHAPLKAIHEGADDTTVPVKKEDLATMIHSLEEAYTFFEQIAERHQNELMTQTEYYQVEKDRLLADVATLTQVNKRVTNENKRLRAEVSGAKQAMRDFIETQDTLISDAVGQGQSLVAENAMLRALLNDS
ncbi:hypothetical protein J8273_6433 [Carpediemonas membranifera]|uniref:Uncharacterized protein n=1 Tax=Carpediemonas membranifera TaxID=201153 RepID=A0A8J6AYP2_9EUKA|nr:hypothetical protein J8273_6433 [Carpediemonas membranifera]|eukprot:KAG9391668.1 hypothetical protein J8273_6433 [Carpediemonas membranifera]